MGLYWGVVFASAALLAIAGVGWAWWLAWSLMLVGWTWLNVSSDNRARSHNPGDE